MRSGEVEIVPGVVGPEWFLYDNWVTATGHAVNLAVRWDPELRRYVCESVTVTREGQPSAPPVTTEALRDVPIGFGITMALLFKGQGDADLSVRDLPNPDGRDPWGRVVPKELKGGKRSDRALQWVAQVYRFAIAIDHPPTKTVEEELGLPRTTAVRWVMAARDAGYLRAAEVGKRGETPATG